MVMVMVAFIKMHTVSLLLSAVTWYLKGGGEGVGVGESVEVEMVEGGGVEMEDSVVMVTGVGVRTAVAELGRVTEENTSVCV